MTLTLYGPETNRIIVWLPPEPQRYALELHDEKGALVKKTRRGEKLGKPFVLPKKPLQESGYRATWAEDREYNTIMPRIRLDELFQIRSPGKFTLTGQVRAIVVVQRGRETLVPAIFDLPPTTLKLSED